MPLTAEPTRVPSFRRLVRAAERAAAFHRTINGAHSHKTVRSFPLKTELGGRLIGEKLEVVQVEVDHLLCNVIDQRLTYRVAEKNPVLAFKNGFFHTAPQIGPRFSLAATRHNGVWQRGGAGLPFDDPNVEAYVVLMAGADVGTAFPGIAKATVYGYIDTSTILETRDGFSFTLDFLNPHGDDGRFPPYVNSFARYGIKDHRDGTVTVQADWLGTVGNDMVEPIARETKVGKGLHALYSRGKDLLGRTPLGFLAQLPMATAEAMGGIMSTALAKAGDVVMSATGASDAIWPLLADRHVVFYERDWCHPDRWLAGAAARASASPVPLKRAIP